MVQEPDELVEMRRVLGEQLAAFRQAAGLNQGELGRATFCDRTSVAHIEKARSRGDERFWKLADERCGAEGVLLAGFRAWETARQDHEVRVRETLLAQARAKLEVMQASTAPGLSPDADRSGRRDVVDGAAGSRIPVTGCAGLSACLRFAGSLREEVAAEGDDEVVGRLVKILCGLVDEVNRRKLLQLLGWATG
ncbi:MAG: helix-turn-helix domain-containing protein, partial [Actinobacteria bacterium]|nr:helix-turn-helix domain-containing protein [Actinomycetota bacterium]